jgi:hypothetical protein
VNVYVVVPLVVVFITEGFHVPAIALVEFTGNGGATEFWHNGPIAVNTGVSGSVINISIVVATAHWPAFGVNVYVVVPVVLVLIVAGFQVPEIPFVEFKGSEGAAAFWHKGPIAEKAGVDCPLIVTSNVVVEAHCPAFGVNV